MAILLIIVAIVAAALVAYKFKKPTPKVEVNYAPEKIEPPVLVKKAKTSVKQAKKTVKEEPKNIKTTVTKVNKNIK
jgi:hypothetical protein